MIITLTGADFSASNIGTLSTWSIQRVLGSGATYSGPTYVDKGASLSATVTLTDGYELGSAGVTVTMGGVTQSSAYSQSGQVITISIASVTGAVVIKVPTVNTSTGEEDGGSSGDSSTYPTITWTVGSIDASTGGNLTGDSRQRTNSIAVSDIVTNITSGGTAAKFLVCCYDSSDAYLGQVSTGLTSLVSGSGQWIAQGTLITQSLLSSLGAATIRMVVNSGSAGSTFIMNGTVLATTVAPVTAEVDYPFELGTITKETGLNSSSSARARTADYFTSDQLGTEFTISECQFLVACYTSDGSYLGQWATDNATVSSEAVLSNAQWLNAGTVINTATLFSSTGYVIEESATTETTGTVGKIRFCAFSSSANPHVYVDGVAMTE